MAHEPRVERETRGLATPPIGVYGLQSQISTHCRSHRATSPLAHARVLNVWGLERSATTMPPTRKPQGPRLEALLDQRDKLRVRISLAQSDGHSSDYDIGDLRRKLLLIDHAIIQQWDYPSA